VPLQNVVPY